MQCHCHINPCGWTGKNVLEHFSFAHKWAIWLTTTNTFRTFFTTVICWSLLETKWKIIHISIVSIITWCVSFLTDYWHIFLLRHVTSGDAINLFCWVIKVYFCHWHFVRNTVLEFLSTKRFQLGCLFVYARCIWRTCNKLCNKTLKTYVSLYKRFESERGKNPNKHLKDLYIW